VCGLLRSWNLARQDSRNKLICRGEMDFMVGAGFVCDGVSVLVAMLMDMIKLIPVHETC